MLQGVLYVEVSICYDHDLFSDPGALLSAPNLLHPIHHLDGGPQRPAHDLISSEQAGRQARRGVTDKTPCTSYFSRSAACMDVSADVCALYRTWWAFDQRIPISATVCLEFQNGPFSPLVAGACHERLAVVECLNKVWRILSKFRANQK